MHQFEQAARLNTAGYAPGILSFVVPKFAVVALLTRLLNPTRAMRVFLWSFVGVGGAFICGCIVIIYGQCSPTRALWTPHLQNARCWNPWILIDYSIVAGGKSSRVRQTFNSLTALLAVSASLDLFLAVYPATVLRKLQVKKKKKVGLIIAFCLGSW